MKRKRRKEDYLIRDTEKLKTFCSMSAETILNFEMSRFTKLIEELEKFIKKMGASSQFVRERRALAIKARVLQKSLKGMCEYFFLQAVCMKEDT